MRRLAGAGLLMEVAARNPVLVFVRGHGILRQLVLFSASQGEALNARGAQAGVNPNLLGGMLSSATLRTLETELLDPSGCSAETTLRRVPMPNQAPRGSGRMA